MTFTLNEKYVKFKNEIFNERKRNESKKMGNGSGVMMKLPHDGEGSFMSLSRIGVNLTPPKILLSVHYHLSLMRTKGERE